MTEELIERIYNLGYEDGEFDGYHSTIIESGIQEEHYGLGLKELQKEQKSDDAISRQEAIKQIQKYGVGCFDADDFIPEQAERFVISKIKELQPIQPKTGHWIEENINEWSRKVFCSECGCPPPFEHVSNGDVYSASGYGVTNKTKYCPNCGAKMVESQKSEE